MSSPKKRGEGTSCHHCKKRIRPNEMLKCTRGEIVPTNARKRKRPCVKKYCLHCIKTFYSTQYLDDNSSGSFICPACNDECRCAACRRRVMKARLKNDGSALENEADGQANSILESQTPDATNIEEGQVNGLLEILDSRPDVQDIIRRGMAMDFADDNAKILYVGHLIDQALTRPDVLALYYASSHGRANNCRIKTESDKEHLDDSALPPDIAQNRNSNSNSNTRSIASSSSSHRASKLKRNGSSRQSRQSRTQSPASNGSPSTSNTRNGRSRSDSTSSTPSSTSHRSSRRKKRNHQEASYNDGDHHRDQKRKSRHKKQKYSPTADPEWDGINAMDALNEMNATSNDTTHLAPPSAVKQEPTNGTPMMASTVPGVSHHIHSVPLHHLNPNHNAHRHLDPQSKSNGNALMMNGISAPQPATMSLSGGNPMSFVNGINSAMTFGGPPHLGLPLPPFPPSHSVLDDGHCRNNGNGNVLNPTNPMNPILPSHSPHSAHPHPPHPSPLTMAPAVSSTVSSEQTSNDPDSAQNGNMFPMNVTPSVMAGGPPLASM